MELAPKRPNAAQKTAILWLTHFHDPEGETAFLRLRREASDFGDVLQVRCGPRFPSHSGNHDHIVTIDPNEVVTAIPSRRQQSTLLRRTLTSGFLDLVHAVIMQRMSSYSHVWIIEYDVDFFGHWGSFFAEFGLLDTDLLGTTLYPRRRSETWVHWRWFQRPPDSDPSAETRGFFPILRMSQRFWTVYMEQIGRGWAGHYESLYPTIALGGGLSVEDIGGRGPLTPPSRQGRLYTNTDDPELLAGTFRYRPPVASSYFKDTRNDSHLKPDHLYHPVKTEVYAPPVFAGPVS